MKVVKTLTLGLEEDNQDEVVIQICTRGDSSSVKEASEQVWSAIVETLVVSGDSITVTEW